MYLTIQGIVLRVTDYNDKDALLTMLTRRHGRLTVKARGLRRKNSPLIAPCQLLAYGEFTLFEYRGQYTINEAQSIELFTPLRRDLTKRESLSMATIAPTAARNPIPWQRRLRNIAYLPKRSLVKRFMDDVIQPAMTLVQEELNKQGTISHISDAVDDRIRLEVDLGNELNFIYEVRLRGYISPTFALAAMDNDEQQTEQHRYYRAEVYLKEGGQNYDVMGWNQEQLINDILDQYEKHLHFLHLVR